MYKHIAKHQTGGEIYANKLIAEGHITAEEVEAVRHRGIIALRMCSIYCVAGQP